MLENDEQLVRRSVSVEKESRILQLILSPFPRPLN